MSKKSISEIAKLYGVSTDCLRYWEKEGLLSFERNPINNYRELSHQITERIGNILMFKKLAIPIKELKKLPYFGLDDFDKLLDKSQEELDKKMQSIQATIDQIKVKKELIKKIKALKKEPFIVEEHAIKAIRPYYYYEPDSVASFFTDPNRFTVLITSNNPIHMLYGFYTDDSEKDYDFLRYADQREYLYLKGLLLVNSENIFDHNSLDFFKKSKELGYEPGEIIGQYLLTLFDGKFYDFYEAWMKLEPIENDKGD